MPASDFRLGDGIYRCQAFRRFIWQTHGFGTRSVNPRADVTLRQIHSDIVWNADGLKDRDREGDALVSDACGLTIGVRTADCVPILMLDAKHRSVAAIHAGWRGSAAEIVKLAVQKMSTDFGSQPADIWAAIGPCVRDCCYDVSADVAARFSGIFPEWGLSAEADGKRKLNLPEANARQMKAAGIPADQIFDSCLCTACQIETFYSYRREPHEPGRLVSAITRIS